MYNLDSGINQDMENVITLLYLGTGLPEEIFYEIQ